MKIRQSGAKTPSSGEEREQKSEDDVRLIKALVDIPTTQAKLTLTSIL